MLTAAAFFLALGAAQDPTHDPEDVAAALKRWHDGYVSGAVELGAPASDRPKSPIYRRLLGDAAMTRTHREGLTTLLDFATETQTVELAERILCLAAVDSDGTRIDPRRRPDVVRSAAISTLGRFTDTRAIFAILEVARGEPETWRGPWHDAYQAAAVRALGAIDRSVTRPTIEAACESPCAEVRLAAAEALHATGPPRSLPTLCAAMARELDPRVAEQLVETARGILQRHVDQCETTCVRDSVHAAIAMLGRTDWRVDLAIVELCDAFRNRAAVEPLIRILERFHEDPDAIDRGQISGILRHRAHEVLESLTGARIPAERPEEWRAFWGRVAPTFVLAKEPEKTAARTSAGFFGIPIRGTRIVFLIDRSGSMRVRHAPSGGGDGNAGDGPELETRYEFARAELLRAAAALPADTRFQVVTFAQDVHRWRENFSAPTDATIRTLRTSLHKRRPDGGTDLYGALAQALELRLSQFGERYDSPVDEIFLLSDGAPSVGEIVDTDQILAIVRQANRHRKVRIHAVFIGPEAESGFMRSLAAQNHGHFVRL